MPMLDGELFEECQMRCGESAQAGQLDDGLDPVFEEHRQHDHVFGRALKSPSGSEQCSSAVR